MHYNSTLTTKTIGMEDNRQDQLALITEMIQTARNQFNDSSNIYVLWGWVVFVASVSQFILIKMHHESMSGLGWLILIPLALVAQVFIMVKMRGKSKVKTHIDKILGYLWTAFGVALGITLFSQGNLQVNTLPMVLTLYGIGTFVSGGIISFRPLIVGGICCWLTAIAGFFVPVEYQLLLLALAVVMAYIIPGYLLKLRHRNNV